MRWVVLSLLAAACSSSAPRPTEPPRPVELALPTPDAPPWTPGQPIACTTVDDCMLVSPGHVSCPGVCGFCGGSVLVPRGYPAIKCPPPPRYDSDDPNVQPPPMPNCAACEEQPDVRAACEANVCVTKPA